MNRKTNNFKNEINNMNINANIAYGRLNRLARSVGFRGGARFNSNAGIAQRLAFLERNRLNTDTASITTERKSNRSQNYQRAKRLGFDVRWTEASKINRLLLQHDQEEERKQRRDERKLARAAEKERYNQLIQRMATGLRIPIEFLPERKQREEKSQYTLVDFLKTTRAYERKFGNNKIARKYLRDKINEWNRLNETSPNLKYYVNLRLKNGAVKWIKVSRDLYNLFLEGFLEDTIEEQFSSDLFKKFNLDVIDHISILGVNRDEQKRLRNNNGSYFPFDNETNIDLSKYQIYKKDEPEDLDNCFIYSMRNFMEKEELTSLRIYLGECNSEIAFSKTFCKEVAKNYDLCINLEFFDGIRWKTYAYNKKGNRRQRDGVPRQADLCLYKSHYFVNEVLDGYSTFYIKNYKKIKEWEKENNTTLPLNITEYNKRKNKYYHKTKDYYKIKTKDVVKHLFTQECFTPKDLIKDGYTAEQLKKEAIKNNKYILTDSTINIEQKPYEIKSRKTKFTNLSHIFVADTEAEILPNGRHKLLLLRTSNLEGTASKTFCVRDYDSTQSCVNNFLWYICNFAQKAPDEEGIVLYFHNLKYDMSLLHKHVKLMKQVEKDGTIYAKTVLHYGHKIILKDSFKMISMALSKFPKALDLPKDLDKKETIAYDYYNGSNDYDRVHFNKYIKYYPKDKREDKSDGLSDFLINNPKFLDENEDEMFFNPLELYKYYLYYDVEVLRQGLLKFNTLMKEVTDCEIWDFLTISSLADYYISKKECYDGCFTLSGNIKQYVQSSIVAGRVTLNDKYIKKEIRNVADYDGNALYPSAMVRLCEGDPSGRGLEKGVPIGKCVMWNGKDIHRDEVCYGVYTIILKKIQKHQQLPIIAYRTKGLINYINKLPDNKPIKLIVSGYDLIEYEKLHKIKYKIIEGVEWLGGYNKKLGAVMRELYNKRLKIKKINKPLADIYKLIMNSSYGKNMLKANNTQTYIISKENINEYLYNNYGSIKEVEEGFDCYIVKRWCPDSSENRCHIAGAILGYSHIIMNEVYEIANDSGIKQYYTDTDSIHMDMKDVNELEKLFRNKYNRELTGPNLSQFEIDFSLGGCEKESIYSDRCIILGKKCYIDVLKGTDKDGNIVTGNHIRMKGITEIGLEYESKNYEDGYLGLYRDLATGTKKNICLNPEGSGKVMFDISTGSVDTRELFYREVKF